MPWLTWPPRGARPRSSSSQSARSCLDEFYRQPTQQGDDDTSARMHRKAAHLPYVLQVVWPHILVLHPNKACKLSSCGGTSFLKTLFHCKGTSCSCLSDNLERPVSAPLQCRVRLRSLFEQSAVASKRLTDHPDYRWPQSAHSHFLKQPP